MLESHIPSDWHRKFNFAKGVMLLSQLPRDTGSEVVVAGRSNVGKSSVINAITDRRNLARTGKYPGRTRELNYFINDTGQRLVDLPGYGYARVGKDLRRKWRRLIQDYFKSRKSIRGVLLIMDVRHPLTAFDEQMLTCIWGHQIVAHVLLNKADKVSKSEGLRVRQQVTQQIASAEISIQLFSAGKRQGVTEARRILSEWFFQSEYNQQIGPESPGME